MTDLSRRRILSGLIAAPAVLVLGAHMPVKMWRHYVNIEPSFVDPAVLAPYIQVSGRALLRRAESGDIEATLFLAKLLLPGAPT